MPDLRLGILLWNMTPDWPTYEKAARRVDELGYDHVWTWDHLHAIFGEPQQSVFDGWMALAAWSKVTSNVRLGLMVGANTFRNPGLVAKMATTLDHMSDGRAILGLGGAWFEYEHRAHGIDFGRSPGDRLKRLDEAVRGYPAGVRRRLGYISSRQPLRVPGPSPGAASRAATPADHDRRRGRAEDAAHRGQIRRHVEPVRDA